MNQIASTIRRIWSWLFGQRSVPEIQGETTDWCLIGNIVEYHTFGDSKQLLRGSKHFTPGAKVYVLPPQWGDGYEKAVVIGLSRRSRRWITVVMPTDQIINWRAKVVYKPAMLRRLREGYRGFKRQWRSRDEVVEMANAMRNRRSESQSG